MSRLNKDTLFLIFEELQNDPKSLFSCLMVNKRWFETVIPILWKNPWRFDINYSNKNSLFIIITFDLPNNTKEFLKSQGLQLPSTSYQSLSSNYLSFCKSINVEIMNNIISIGSTSVYDQFLFQQEIYSLLIKKCREMKYLDIISLKHQIFYFPGATCLGSLIELKCDTSIDPSYFYGLARVCRRIQRLIIINKDLKPNHGIVKLIEFQENLKYFQWKDNIEEECFIESPYDKIFFALTKKADKINHLKIYFQFIDGCDHTFLQKILPKFSKLKSLIIGDFILIKEEQLKTSIYQDLEILNIDYIKMNTVASMVENSGGHIKEILLKYYYYYYYRDNDFYKDSLIFIRKIYENCPEIEYLSLLFSSSKEHFAEFEKLLKVCKNLKSVLLIISNIYERETYEKIMSNGEELLKVLIKSAPKNLREIRFFDYFKFSLKNLEFFLENWKERPPLTIITSDSVYNGEAYMKLIDKYKNNGVIKDFRCDSERNIYFR
ncbi:uncharacterized protein OCT59_010121 [Rhizophagus irregularis]|uniref:F-box domain-containing protein n=2 Tax=Rhizophagus irregularis TaxID=588596 RepID=A0A015K9F3_RHIIW|nr:hypothetical protein RirG_035510 [Rhizophagus irregularis DAOM 197198w]UZO18812.1 hypothetical protein OCT59_010121 [Rhizophagus irregularis]GBC38779.1 hypothetical protein GLOIN_2v1764020 [Rhizophagus irregularis DAOM 181602=DAOM 197198]